eukprot:COSAG06_NODE_4515_length_4189_cov_12.834230_1_plen_70_part_00
MSVSWDDGTTETMLRRERPFVVVVNGSASFLFNAVSPAKGTKPPYSYTMVQPIATRSSRSDGMTVRGLS